jgi:serine acetyltransferase
VEERASLAQALVERLREPLGALVLDDGARSGEVELLARRKALGALPEAIAAFCRDLDVRLVQLMRREAGAWEAVLAWSDDVGRPRFLAVAAYADWYRDGVLLLREEELREPSSEIRFIHALLKCVSRASLGDDEGRYITARWHEAPRQAMEQVARFWRRPPDIRIVAQAARQGIWSNVRANFPRLRRALRRGTPYLAASLAGRLRRLYLNVTEPARAVIAFVGADPEHREAVRDAVARDLAPVFPSGTATMAYGFADERWGVDLRVVFGDADYVAQRADAVLVDSSAPGAASLGAAVASAERAILHWLESRVERRHPDLLVGRNPPAARLLQTLSRRRYPVLTRAIQVLLNSDIDIRLRSPILMPHPYGIVIERGAEIGHRVSIGQQASIGCSEGGAAPVIEDNVRIGAGARILGRVRIGRYATIAPNAVVTRDVPSHCTVTGENRIVGEPQPPVVLERRASRRGVVNS